MDSPNKRAIALKALKTLNKVVLFTILILHIKNAGETKIFKRISNYEM